jgi:hypothetical protein
MLGVECEPDNLYRIPFTLSEESQEILDNNINGLVDLRKRISNVCKNHGYELCAVHWMENLIIAKKV